MIFVEHAPAKLNLSLEVTGKRSDGYHTLSSIVAFTKFGDTISISESETTELVIVGPYANHIGIQDNLALKALTEWNKVSGNLQDYKITLEKNIPVAAGLGGGSADAAAVIRLLEKLDPIETNMISEICNRLGADVLMCYHSRAVQVSGIGEVIDAYLDLPELHILLVNPNKQLITADVFRKYQGLRDGAQVSAEIPKQFTLKTLLKSLHSKSNDLTDAAISFIPEIGRIIELLKNSQGCQLSRMTGSGATCFGIFENAASVALCATRIKLDFPLFWVQETTTKKHHP